MICLRGFWLWSCDCLFEVEGVGDEVIVDVVVEECVVWCYDSFWW